MANADTLGPGNAAAEPLAYAGFLPCYWWEVNGNCGDLLAPVVVRALSGLEPLHVKDLAHRYLTVGSVVHFARDGDLLWGTGMLHDALPQFQPRARRLRVSAVRGPLTRDRLRAVGIEAPKVYGDPGLLIPHLYPTAPTGEVGVGLVPHFAEHAHVRQHLAGGDVAVIDVRTDFRQVLRQIARCRLVLSSSLHGLILAEAVGVAARHARFGGLPPDLAAVKGLGDFKFHDYYLGTGRGHPGVVDCTTRAALADARAALADATPAVLDPSLLPGLLAACPFNFRAITDPGGLRGVVPLAAY